MLDVEASPIPNRFVCYLPLPLPAMIPSRLARICTVSVSVVFPCVAASVSVSVRDRVIRGGKGFGVVVASLLDIKAATTMAVNDVSGSRFRGNAATRAKLSSGCSALSRDEFLHLPRVLPAQQRLTRMTTQSQRKSLTSIVGCRSTELDECSTNVSSLSDPDPVRSSAVPLRRLSYHFPRY